MRHLLQRWRDEAREAYHVRFLAPRSLQDRLCRDHHTEVHDIEVIALEHDGDDVFADVVHVAFHGSEHDATLGAASFA